MTAEVRYISAARAPAYIDVNKTYHVGHDERGYFLQLSDRREYVTEWLLRRLYQPVDGTSWDVLLAVPKPSGQSAPKKRAAKNTRKPFFTEDIGAVK